MRALRRETRTAKSDEPSTGAPSSAGQEQMRVRIERFRSTRQRNVLRVPEIVGLAAAGFLLVAALFSYFYLLLPERSRLQRAVAEHATLQSEMRLATEGVKEQQSTEATVQEIVNSLDTFESRHLVSRNQAATAVIEELNTLIRRNNLKITTGVSFTQFDEATPQTSQQRQRAPVTTGAAKALQDVFPGVGVSLTVEGAYPSLRRFIRDIEADRRFIVINAVELEGVTDTSAASRSVMEQPGAEGAAASPPPTQRATLVSLRLDLAAYFRRLGAPVSTEATPSE